MRSLATFIVLVLIHSVVEAGTTTVTVGSDPGCDYDSIMNASFNAPASDSLSIRVAKNVSLNAIQLLANRNTVIWGGYDDCSDTSPSGRTVLDGGGFSGPIFIPVAANSTEERTTLRFGNLEITNGNSNSDGGAISISGSWFVSFWNVYMHENISNQDGGAIYVKAADDLSVVGPNINVFGNSILNSNSADNGGAIACDGNENPESSVFVWQSQLAFNNASENGGAVHVSNDCDFYLYEGAFLQGILLNDAVGFGGGVHATNSSWVVLESHRFTNNAAVVISNTAANGGGISVSNNASVYAFDAVISDNTASSTGGGIRSTDGHINIRRTKAGAQCHSEVRCSRISNNVAQGVELGFAGGGAIATFGGSLQIRGTYLENNSANYGSAIRARFMPLDIASNSTITIVGNVFAGNSDAPQVVFLDESSADIAFSTFVDNNDMARVIEMVYQTTADDPHSVTVSGSIFDQAGDDTESVLKITPGPLVVGDCNRNEENSLGDLVGQPRSSTFNVAFEDRAAGDYRIQDDTFFIDYCDNSLLEVISHVSANGFQRPRDNGPSDHFGTFELGGLERYDLDLIFEDGF